jgi:hypothetical protein
VKPTRLGLPLTAAGAILLVTLVIPGAPLSIKVVGFVLLVAGLSQLRLPRGSISRLRRQFDRVIGVLDPGTDEPEAPSASLDELLRAVPDETPPAG